MAIISSTTYTGTYNDYTLGSASLGTGSASSSFPLTKVTVTNIFGTRSYYKFDCNGTNRYTDSSPVVNGNYLYDQDAADNNTWTNSHVTGVVSVVGTSVNTGSRSLTVKCGIGGALSTPSIGSNISLVVGSTASAAAIPNFYTAVALAIVPQTGTLLLQGYGATTFIKWTKTSNLTASSLTDPSITVSLTAGKDDQTLTASFTTQVLNSASTWCPGNGKVIIHLLDGSNNETADISTSYLGTTTGYTWSDFRAKAFTALSCSSGAANINWYNTYPENKTSNYQKGAYLLNVESAVFSVTPLLDMRVYAWKLKLPNGTFVDFGTLNTATIGAPTANFEEGCEVHLYLTSATPNPKLMYDGFDSASGGIVPANQAVKKDGSGSYPAPSVWGAVYGSLSLTLSPLAWASKVLGQSRYLIIDGGTPIALQNVAGTSAAITSSSVQYSVVHIKFRQTTLATDGVLAVTVVVDVITAIGGVSVAVSQEGTPLGTLTATGNVGYYIGQGNLSMVVAVNYGAAAPSNYTVRIVPEVVEDGEVVETGSATLVSSASSSGSPRKVTVYVTQTVNMGSLSAVAVNVTRDLSIGTQIATSAGPITQSFAGTISATMITGQSCATPIYVECSAAAGYTLKSVRVVDAATGLKTYYAGAAPSVVTPIYLNIPRADNGANIKVILVVSAEILGVPIILPMLPDDLGKFTATVTSVGGFGDFRVGDSVLLNAAPISVGSAMTGVAIGSPSFNDAVISPVRTGVAVAATVTLARGENVFKIPVYCAFETATTPVGAGTPTVTTTWDVEDTLVITAATYRRIGSSFTATAPLTSALHTAIAARINRRSVTAPFSYVEVASILPTVVGETERSFTAVLRGPTQCVVVYAQGVTHPVLTFAAYDYGTGAYITQGIRPSVTTTPVAPATLSDNSIDTITWPVEADTPGTDYTTAAFIARSVTTSGVLPNVVIRITSSRQARLEVWSTVGAVPSWIPYTPETATLAAAFTFFRVCVGDAPENLVSVVFETAVNEDGVDVPGCSVYATSGAVYDGNFALPATMQARSRTVLHARVTPPYGYVVVGWYSDVDGVLSELVNGASLSIVIPDTGLILKPRLAARVVTAKTVMVLNADPNRTDEGIWVSKLFRAQFPWKPLTAALVARPEMTPVTLAVMKDGGGSAPETLDLANPGTTAITVTGNDMRRLPPGVIQKSRFVRYMLIVSGGVSVASVAIGSGAETMKRGH